jgi:hypothetical protein
VATTTHDRDQLQHELEQSIRHVLTLSRGRQRLSGKTVHEMRKVLKRVRAALRLVRDAVGKDEYARENALLRDAGRALRAARDAEVMLGVIAGLEQTKAAKRTPAPLARVRTRYARARAQSLRQVQTRELRRHISHPLEEAQHRLHKWCLPYELQPITRAGLDRVYRRARKAARLARSGPSDAALHEARKQTKYLATALELLHPRKRRGVKLRDRAAKVAKRLGDDHDLALALPALSRPRDAKRLRKTIRRRRGELQRDALKQAKKLYRKKPQAFVRQIAL